MRAGCRAVRRCATAARTYRRAGGSRCPVSCATGRLPSRTSKVRRSTCRRARRTTAVSVASTVTATAGTRGRTGGGDSLSSPDSGSYRRRRRLGRYTRAVSGAWGRRLVAVAVVTAAACATGRGVRGRFQHFVTERSACESTTPVRSPHERRSRCGHRAARGAAPAGRRRGRPPPAQARRPARRDSHRRRRPRRSRCGRLAVAPRTGGAHRPQPGDDHSGAGPAGGRGGDPARARHGRPARRARAPHRGRSGPPVGRGRPGGWLPEPVPELEAAVRAWLLAVLAAAEADE